MFLAFTWRQRPVEYVSIYMYLSLLSRKCPDATLLQHIFNGKFYLFTSDVVDMKRDCQGPCQHTSCQACSWVDPDPDCVACALNDYGCIKRFAKCIKRSYCTRSKFPCKAIAVSVLILLLNASDYSAFRYLCSEMFWHLMQILWMIS